MPNTYPRILASSQDATSLSLSVSSAIKVVLFVTAYFAVHKGLDPFTAQNQVQGLIDLTLNIVPLVLALYHAVQLGWGLCRKLLSFAKSKPAVPGVDIVQG